MEMIRPEMLCWPKVACGKIMKKEIVSGVTRTMTLHGNDHLSHSALNLVEDIQFAKVHILSCFNHIGILSYPTLPYPVDLATAVTMKMIRVSTFKFISICWITTNAENLYVAFVCMFAI